MGSFGRSFFQLGLRGLKQNAVEDWSAGRGGPVCHLGLGDGRILEIYGFGAPIGHLGLRNDCLLDMLLGAGSTPEDCGMVCLQGVDPDRPKVNQAPRRLKMNERVADFFFVKSLKNPWMML